MIELLEVALDETAWDAFSRGSAIRRAGRAGFARNVCVGLGNWSAADVAAGNSGSLEAVPVLISALSDPEPLVRAHAAWALGRVDSAETRAALSSRASVESDESVRSELAAALGPCVPAEPLRSVPRHGPFVPLPGAFVTAWSPAERPPIIFRPSHLRFPVPPVPAQPAVLPTPPGRHGVRTPW